VDAGNFGLIDRRVADELLKVGDHDRYYPGLRSWIGFRQTGVSIERQSRYDQAPKVSLIGLVRLAKSAFFSFSALPLTVFYAIFVVALVVFLGLAAFTLYHKLHSHLAIPGWTSQIMVACFFGALNALGIAVLGEYVIRIYDQVRGRPLFIVERVVNVAAELHKDSANPTTRTARAYDDVRTAS
jgi:dolichol-phosphate mannosyltransferase